MKALRLGFVESEALALGGRGEGGGRQLPGSICPVDVLKSRFLGLMESSPVSVLANLTSDFNPTASHRLLGMRIHSRRESVSVRSLISHCEARQSRHDSRGPPPPGWRCVWGVGGALHKHIDLKFPRKCPVLDNDQGSLLPKAEMKASLQVGRSPGRCGSMG